ncbi:RNase III domain-containing protein [Fusarium keratoplasticum]|nr:RNase III domain-containing protein [Fusarium keratoplasticum]
MASLYPAQIRRSLPPIPTPAMALQPCRSGLVRSRQAARSLMPCLRTYATDSTTTTPESFKTPAAGAQKPVPRWSQTPVGMKAPVQLDFAKNPHNKVWTVNNDPRKLDEVYERLLGQGGSKLLPEELKWLAVTHKSFDQGRRGFNDRLALLGRMTLIMETTKSIVAKDPIPGSIVPDEFERTPFEHPQLQSLDNLTMEGPRDVAGKDKLYHLAAQVGLIDVVRWKPRLVRKLKASGLEVVLNGAIMAIIGAITLQHGAVVASQVVRERILARLPKD